MRTIREAKAHADDVDNNILAACKPVPGTPSCTSCSDDRRCFSAASWSVGRSVSSPGSALNAKRMEPSADTEDRAAEIFRRGTVAPNRNPLITTQTYINVSSSPSSAFGTCLFFFFRVLFLGEFVEFSYSIGPSFFFCTCVL